MSTAVVMPQMGESIAEGTIVRWIKKVGDRVDRDEPLFEISTDKVDAEIPSPAAGVLSEIKVKEGETVGVNTVVGTISAEGESVAPPSPSAPDDLRRQKSSPLVRRIARDHHVDITALPGSGSGGRVTKHDILQFLDKQPADARVASPSPVTAATPPTVFKPGERVEIQPLSPMRKKIAEHMVLSRRTSAHVHSVFHVNFSTVDRLRQQKRADYEGFGTKLTYMAFIAKAVVDAIRRHPVMNASLDGDNVVYKKDVNLGIAVALESGLIVPVIKNADEKNLLGLSRAIADVGERARAKQLKPDEVHGGTFTITNPGVFGAQFGMPIINQPQVAILGVGTIEKRPVVVDDAIAIRTMGYLTLGFDHRLVDGATADQFMADVKQQLEQFDSNQV
jgi:pyruvate dehydrogenase E2 component (dihydrolipoamide acetyltransferase)